MNIGYRENTVPKVSQLYLYPNYMGYNDDKLFYASNAKNGAGRWYLVRQIDTPADGTNDWALHVWDGTTPATSGDHWTMVANENWTTPPMTSTNIALAHRDTERMVCAWDDENNTLHFCALHFRGTDTGANYNNVVMTPSTGTGADTWTGRGAASSKNVINQAFVNHGGDAVDNTAAGNWPIQMDRFSMAVEPAHAATTTWPRVWISFPYSANNTDISYYANCSTSADFNTWEEDTGTEDWGASDSSAGTTEASSTITDYMALVADSNWNIASGTGETQNLHDDAYCKLVTGKTSNVPFVGLAYTDGNERWYYIERSTAAAPTAGSPGFGAAVNIIDPGETTAEANGVSHHIHIKSYLPGNAGTTHNLVFCGKTADHKLRICARTGATWTTALSTQTTNYGWYNPVIDPITENIFVFAQNNYSTDFADTGRSVDLRVINKDTLSGTISDWTPVIQQDSETVMLAPLIGNSTITPDGKIVVFSTMQGASSFNWDGAVTAEAAAFYHAWNQIDQSLYTNVDTGQGSISSIVMTSPTAGEVVTIGESVSITWTTS